jgi:palmitoyltransferase ZDHHC9/14/18
MYLLEEANVNSPFSTKNIQECHCGTRSCRGVLGPKPKKPANEMSFTSSLIAGTKRKLNDLFSKDRTSESAPNSPKKRLMANSAVTKARNALAQTEAEREKAKKEANALAAQIASRENRAMKRGNPTTSSRRRAGAITTTRQTTFNIRRSKVQHKVSKPSALKKPAVALRRNAAMTKPKKGLPPPKTTRKTQRSATPDSRDDESPNITPASLRSANKITLLPAREVSSSSRDSMSMTSESDDEDRGLELAIANIRGKKRGDAPAPRDIHRTGAGVTKTSRRVRNERGWFVKK